MFVPVDRLLMRLRKQPASRADEVATLRGRLRVERGRPIADDERDLAAAVKARKLEVAREVGAVRSCSGCASRQPWPVGGYDGGACCSGVTAVLFDEHELAALAHAGTAAD